MDKYEVIKAFRGAPSGHTVISYEVGEILPNDIKPFSDELAAVAVGEGWIIEKKVIRPKETKRGRN